MRALKAGELGVVEEDGGGVEMAADGAAVAGGLSGGGALEAVGDPGAATAGAEGGRPSAQAAMVPATATKRTSEVTKANGRITDILRHSLRGPPAAPPRHREFARPAMGFAAFWRQKISGAHFLSVTKIPGAHFGAWRAEVSSRSGPGRGKFASFTQSYSGRNSWIPAHRRCGTPKGCRGYFEKMR